VTYKLIKKEDMDEYPAYSSAQTYGFGQKNQKKKHQNRGNLCVQFYAATHRETQQQQEQEQQQQQHIEE
jgi:hypothetical protein